MQQIFTKKVQFHHQIQLHLPDAQQNFAVMYNKEELIESQMEKIFCIWMYKDASGDVSGDLLVTRE